MPTLLLPAEAAEEPPSAAEKAEAAVEGEQVHVARGQVHVASAEGPQRKRRRAEADLVVMGPAPSALRPYFC